MYDSLKKFIKEDLEIKNTIINMCPPKYTDLNSEHEVVKYVNRTYQDLRYIFRELKNIIKPFYIAQPFLKKIDEFEKVIMKKYIDCKTDLDKISDFYLKYIADLQEDVVKSIRNEIYNTYEQIPNESINKCKTINELLHVMHFSIFNNSNILEECNLINKKFLNNGYEISLYGEESELGESIFNIFPNEIDCGYTNIVPFPEENKVIMMIRDKGHFTSIEIDKLENDTYRISYFIPKICNANMVNQLKGVNKVDKNSEYYNNTTGLFYTTSKDFMGDLFTLINMIPMDKDVVITR